MVGTLLADGMTATDDAATADLVVVNTCAFIDEARRESIDTILALEEQRKKGASWWSPVAWPSATATSWPAHPAEWPGSACRSTSPPAGPEPSPSRRAAAQPGSAEPAAEGHGAVGLRRSPRVDCTNSASVIHGFYCIHDMQPYPRRGGATEGQGDRIGPVTRHSGRPAGELRRLRQMPCGARRGWARGSACCTCIERPHRRVDRRHLRHRRAVLRPVAAARQQAFAGCAGGARPRFLQRIETSAGASRQRRPQQLSSATPVREEDHDRLLEFVRTPMDWCGSSPTAQRTAHAATLTSRCPSPDARTLAELPELRMASPPPGATTDRYHHRGVGGRTGPGAALEAPEIDGVVEVPHALAVGEFHAVRVVDALGPDLVADSL